MTRMREIVVCEQRSVVSILFLTSHVSHLISHISFPISHVSFVPVYQLVFRRAAVPVSAAFRPRSGRVSLANGTGN